MKEGEAMIPILMNHDHTQVVGVIEVQDGQLHVRFSDQLRITREMAFDILGNAGLQVLQYVDDDGVMIIKRARIVEWSLGAEPASLTVAPTERPAEGGATQERGVEVVFLDGHRITVQESSFSRCVVLAQHLRMLQGASTESQLGVNLALTRLATTPEAGQPRNLPATT